MEIIFLVISAFIAGLFSAFLFIDEKFIKKIKSSKNHVHFYVARDQNESLWLYLSKPRRLGTKFCACERGNALTISKYFSKYGLSVRDFDSLKCEDEPVEVFLNLDD